MTVIAWDGKTLAADRQCNNNGTIEAITKIFATRGHLLAGAGSAFLTQLMREWWEGGANPADYPKDAWEAYADSSFWVIRPDGSVCEYGTKFPVAVVVDQQPMAIGCGRRCALAAMHMGADATKAVEVACAIEVECGMGIDTLALERPDPSSDAA